MRLLADATKEKDESHAGKVVERSWYQRNKHIFPASRWEVSVHVHSGVHLLTSEMSDCRASCWVVGGIRCLNRRKTMESIPLLRLCEFIRRISFDFAVLYHSILLGFDEQRRTVNIFRWCYVRMCGPCALSVLSLLSRCQRKICTRRHHHHVRHRPTRVDLSNTDGPHKHQNPSQGCADRALAARQKARRPHDAIPCHPAQSRRSEQLIMTRSISPPL